MRGELAALVATGVLACGDNVRVAPAVDAPERTRDAPSDGSPGPIGPVRVTVRDDLGIPVEGARLVFINPDGGVVAALPTDENGVAAVNMVEGGSVTAVRPFGADVLYTILDVQHDDDLAFAAGPPQPPPATATITLAFSADRGGNVAAHRVFTSCGTEDRLVGGMGASRQLAIAVRASCTQADVLVVSEHAAGTPLRAYLVQGVMLQSGQVTTVTGTPAAIPALDVRFVGIPVSTTQLAWTYALASAGGQIFRRAVTTAPVDGTATARVPMPGGMAIAAFAVDGVASGPAGIGRRFAVSLPVAAGGYEVDVGSLVPVGFADAPSYDLASHAVVAAFDGDPGALDVAGAVVARTRDVDGMPRTWTWEIVGPAPPLSFPVLPVADDGFDPNAAAGDTTAVVTAIATGLADSYAVARPAWFTPGRPTLPVLPTTTFAQP